MPEKSMAVGIISDGSFDWSLGVDSVKTPTVQSQLNPNGLERNALAWLANGTVRDGGITTRWGWNPLGIVSTGQSLFQGAALYQPIDGSTPYYIASIGGHIYQIYADAASNPVDLGLGVEDEFPPGTPSAINPQWTVVLEWTYLTPTDVVVGDTISYSGGTNAGLNVNGLQVPFDAFVIPAQNVPVYVQLVAGNISSLSAGQSIQLWLTQGAHGGNNVATVWNVIAVIPGGVINRSPVPAANIVNPAFNPYSYFVQAEQFMVIQAGDYTETATPASTQQNGYWVVQLQCTYLTPNDVLPGDTLSVDSLFVAPNGQVANGLNCNFDPFTIPQVGGGVTVQCSPGQIPTTGGVLVAAGDQIQFWYQNGPHGGTNVATNWTVVNAVYVVPSQTPTLPLFWDGTTLSRSQGITNLSVAPGTPGINQLPPGGPMCYYMGRLWYASSARTYCAGDIVGGASGTQGYNFTDSILNVTENPLVIGGDGFTVPAQAGNITALTYNSQLDEAFGQGLLTIFCTGQVYCLQVPVTRADWIAANSQNPPFQFPVVIDNGSVNDRSVVSYNGDLYYLSNEPGVRSLINAIRYFDTFGNTPISANEQRIFNFSKASLSQLQYASGITWDSRLLMTALPKQVSQGTVFQVLMPLDFTPLAVFNKKDPPSWEGHYEGLQFLQLLSGNYSGQQRAFAFVVSEVSGSIELWELTDQWKSDNNPGDQQNFPGITPNAPETRITMVAELPAFTWSKDFDLKRLVAGELWIDSLFGEAIITVEYRPDSDLCWHPWAQFKVCSARNSAENLQNPAAYPLTQYRSGYRSSLMLPTPPLKAESVTDRPLNVAYCFQPRITVKGYLRIRGFMLHAQLLDKQLGLGLIKTLT